MNLIVTDVNKRYFYFTVDRTYSVKCVRSNAAIREIRKHGKVMEEISTELYNSLQLHAREVLLTLYRPARR